MGNVNSNYNIIARFSGIDGVVASFGRIQRAEQQTTQSITRGSKAQIVELHKLKEEYAGLQRAMKQDLATVTVGAAGMGVFVKGVKVAADFESSMTELRLSIQRLGKDGSVDLSILNSQMERFEKLGVKLGNNLPGSTKDFIDMFVALRQGGLDTESVLGGAGEAVAHLAVVAKETPADLAKAYAQLGNMFKLKPEDYGRSADLMARLYRTTGQKPGELIEGAKFFQPRAGLPMGLSGMQGLTTGAELLGVLKRFGLEGGIGGRELSILFGRLTLHRTTQQKALAALKRQGINLEFFDQKGNFAGLENFFAQMAKLQKLNPKMRAEINTKLFGEESKGPAEAFTQIGAKGFRDFESELKAVPPLLQQIDELVRDVNNKWENLLGTAENVAARAFKPILKDLKPILDTSNKILGSIEGFLSQHDQLAEFAGGFLGIGSAVMIAVGGFNAARTAIGLYSVATKIARGETFLLAAQTKATAAQVTASSQITRAQAEAMLFGTGAAAEQAATKVRWYNKELKGIKGMVGTVVVLSLATETLAYIMQLKAEAEAAWEEAKGSAQGSKDATRNLYKVAPPETLKKLGESEMPGAIRNFLGTPGIEGALGDTHQTSLQMLIKGLFVHDPRYNLPNEARAKLATGLNEWMPDLNMPSRLLMFKRALRGMNLGDQQKLDLYQAAETAQPEAARQVSAALTTSKGDEVQAMNALIEADKKAVTASENASIGVQKFATAAEAAAGRLDGIQVNGNTNNNDGGTDNKGKKKVAYRPAATDSPMLSNVALYGQPVGTVLPATSFIGRSDSAHMGAEPISLVYSPSITLQGSNSETAKREIAMMLHEHKRDISQILSERIRDRELS